MLHRIHPSTRAHQAHRVHLMEASITANIRRQYVGFARFARLEHRQVVCDCMFPLELSSEEVMGLSVSDLEGSGLRCTFGRQ